MITAKQKIDKILPFLARGDSPDNRFPDHNGEYWTLCPFCPDDRHAQNFSISERGYSCFVCGNDGGLNDLVTHFGITFSGNGNGKKGKFDFQNPTAKYKYHDSTGRELYQVWRDGNKNFMPLHNFVNGRGKGGYPSSGRVLYHLPEVLKADTVFFVEGEKSCDAVRAENLTATCIPGGANAKWSDNYTQALAGKNVVIFPDNDDPGRKFADRASQKLTGNAASVLVADIPGLADGQDIEDYIKQGHTKPDLLMLAANAKPATATATAHYSPSGHGGARPGSGRPQKEALLTEDYIQILENFGYDFALNLLDDSIENHGERFSDIDLDVLHAQVSDYCIVNGYKQSVSKMDWAISTAANNNAYHPIKQWLKSLKWDGQDYIGKLAGHFKDKNGVFPRWSFLWLVGAVAKVYEAYQNPVLVLLGLQEIGKSFLASWLCPRHKYFYEGAIFPDDKDHVLRLANTLVWEVSELTSTTSRRDVNALKAFLTQQRVRLRKAWGKSDIEKPALASFIGTDNAIEVLQDRTGNRRFLVCELESIDWSYSRNIDPNQLWAQAYAIYMAGDDWRMTKDERKLRDKQNTNYLAADPLLEWLNEHLEKTGNPSDVMNFNAIWHGIMGTPGVSGKLGMSHYIPQGQYRQAAYKMSTWAKQNDIDSETKRNVKHYKGIRLL